MKNKKLIIITAGLIGSLITAPAFAENDNDKRERLKRHYQERHQMNIDMMSMLKETMTILSNLNHKPTGEEKKRLGEMIKQLDGMMARHKELGDMWKERPMGSGPHR